MEVINEYDKVLYMYRALINLSEACGSSEYADIIKVALIESILTRSRNLIQFFKIVRGRRYKDVIYYLPYLRRGIAREFRRRVRSCPGYENAQRIIREVNKYVVHLTRETIESGSKEALDVNGVTVIIRLLCCVFSVFIDCVDTRVVEDDVISDLRSLVNDCVKY